MTHNTIREATRENFEYLVATLSKRTAGKKYENFVVNAIWNELGDDTLRPVTQQYVNRKVRHRGLSLVDLQQEPSKGETPQRAQIDLYFPALRLGVECDEAAHLDFVEEDLQRTHDIARAIPGYEEHRISVQLNDDKVAVSPGAVLDQIATVVERIRERKAEVEQGLHPWAAAGLVVWESATPDWKLALESGMLRAGDGLVYKHNGEVRELFGFGDGTGEKKNHFRSNFEPADPRTVVWCPTLARRGKDGRLHTTNQSGIINWIFVEDGEVLIGQSVPTLESQRRRDEAHALRAAEPAVLPKPPLPDWEYAIEPEEASRREATPDWAAPEPGITGADMWQSANHITFVRTVDGVGRPGFQFLGVFTPVVGYRFAEGLPFIVHRMTADWVQLPAAAGGAADSAATEVTSASESAAAELSAAAESTAAPAETGQGELLVPPRIVEALERFGAHIELHTDTLFRCTARGTVWEMKRGDGTNSVSRDGEDFAVIRAGSFTESWLIAAIGLRNPLEAKEAPER